MATLKNAPKGALASAAEVLVNAATVPATDDNQGADWVPGSTGFVQGKFNLGADAELVSIAGLAMKGEDAVKVTWSMLADILHGLGIRAETLAGKDAVEETRTEVEDFIAVVRFGNYVAAVYQRDGVEVKVPAVDDLRAKRDKKSIHWKMMSEERRQLAQVREDKVRVYINRIIENLKDLSTGKTKGKQVKGSIEAQYLDLLGPVLLFLQKIDLTKTDPKFDWTEEFNAVSAAVNRAKVAKNLAGG